MNPLSTHYVVNQCMLEVAPGVPQQVQQLTYQLETKMAQILSDFGYYGLLLAGFTAAASLLFGCLLLLSKYPITKTVQPSVYLISGQVTYRYSKRMVDTCIARSNRAELRLASARIRAGQLSN